MGKIINGIHDADATLQAGQVALANEATITTAFMSEPLSNFIKADPSANDLSALLDYLAGNVQAGRRFEYRVAAHGGKIAVTELNADIRAAGGSFKVIEAAGQVEQGKTLSKGLTMAIDLDDDKENPNAREEAALYLKRLLLTLEINRVLALIEANATPQNIIWGDAVGGVWADPDSDLMQALHVETRNANPNRALIGATALANRFRALRAGDPSKGATSMLTLDQLAGLIGLESIRSEKIVYLDNDGASKNLIPGNKVYGFHQPTGGTRYDASNIKRFTTGGWRVFERELEALVLVTVSHYSDIVMLDKEGLVVMEVA